MLAGESGPAVSKVQQALIDLGYRIPDGATGTFGPQTGAAVVQFKTAKGLYPNDPVVGPGTSRELDAAIHFFDQGNAAPPPPSITTLKSKFYFGGDGAKVPYTDFGLGFAIFKFFLYRAAQWRGYTVATNAPLLGACILESPVVQYSAKDDIVLANLHGRIVDVAISPTTFIKDGGNAQFSMIVRTNSGNDPELKFHADGIKGYSAVQGAISFNATLIELPSDEWNADQISFVPW